MSTTKPLSARMTILASAAGTAFEWYDFFIFGSLAPLISKNFFSSLPPTSAYLAALALFGVGFGFRPLGALIFGRIGDRLGRKGAFLATVLMMGAATFAIALLPTYEAVGFWAPCALVLLRCVQGIALGGEYGGAVIYVAEHCDSRVRGESTAWIQSSAAFGLLGALLAIWGTRTILGHVAPPGAFDIWGWRIPFAISLIFLIVSVAIRYSLSESPAFAHMKSAGGVSDHPLRTAFGEWKNLKLVILALFSVMVSQGAVWYTTFFYAQSYLEKTLKVDGESVTLIMMAITGISSVAYVLFGKLSDAIGRKPVMLGGMVLAIIAYFPGFMALGHLANPALMSAQRLSPVTIAAPGATCHWQFDPVGKARFDSACDIAKAVLSDAGITYASHESSEQNAKVFVGTEVLSVSSGRELSAADLKAYKAEVSNSLHEALKRAGYPQHADPQQVNILAIMGVLMIFVVAATALFGPLAASLVELFPAQIRYTALSLPYHIGTGWVGGFLPFFAVAIVTASGNSLAGLAYPFAFTLLGACVTLFFLPETRGRDLSHNATLPRPRI